jgi:PAS domain S-box-containing protein
MNDQVTDPNTPSDPVLKPDENIFKLLTEKSFIGLYIIQDAKMAYMNPSCARIFGYTPDEVIGRLSPKDLIHPDDIGTVMKRLQERMEGKTEKSPIAYKGVKKDGSIVWIEVYGTQINYHGKPGVMGTLLDVTNRKKAEDALLESESKYKFLVDRMMEMAFILDKTGTIRFANKFAYKTLGYEEKEVIGKSIADFLTPVTLAKAMYSLGQEFLGITNRNLKWK